MSQCQWDGFLESLVCRYVFLLRKSIISLGKFGLMATVVRIRFVLAEFCWKMRSFGLSIGACISVSISAGDWSKESAKFELLFSFGKIPSRS